MSTLNDQPCKCADCEWTGTRAELGTDIEDCKDLEQRLSAGAPVPAGECPKCQAFAYLVEPTKVWVAQYEHKHGMDIRVFSCKELAEAWRKDLALEYWESFNDTPKPADDVIADLYWENVEDYEWFTYDEITVEGA